MEPVCVTGAGGYLATELIHQLLAKGYDVRATARSLREDKVGHLTCLAAALPGTLELFQADLLQEGSFDAAFTGCRYIFHTASPFSLSSHHDPQRELVEPAVQGTRNVLAAAAAHKGSVRRVVLTSSSAAMRSIKAPAPPGGGRRVHNEADWNSNSTLADEPYCVSKVQAERAAWAMAAELRLDLVTILPQFVMGPVISRRADGASVAFMKEWVEGRAQNRSAPVFVDVRDVARAHILAAETPTALGRYLVAHTHTTPPSQLSAWLQERFPEYVFERGAELASKESVDSSRVVQELGLHLRPLKETMCDMALTLIQLGIAEPRRRASSTGSDCQHGVQAGNGSS